MNELNVVERLKDIVEDMYSTLKQKGSFAIHTANEKGEVIGTYSNDRESYLQFGLEVAFERLNEVVEEMEEHQEPAETSIKAYEKDNCYIYDDDENQVLIEYDLTWGTATAYNDDGDILELNKCFKSITSIQDFETIAKSIIKIIEFVG